MSKRSFIYKPVAIGVLSVIASYAMANDNPWIWNGSLGDYKDNNNWSYDTSDPNNLRPDLGVGSVIINSGEANLTLTDDFNGLSFGWASLDAPTQLLIGGATSEEGKLNIVFDTNVTSNSKRVALNIGQNGGTGTLFYDVRNSPATDQWHRKSLYFENITLGSGITNGVQSQGFLNILGSGKNTYEQFMDGEDVQSGELIAGTGGGLGQVNIDGGSLYIEQQYYNAPEDSKANGIIVLGSGTNSVGSVNILGGGKLYANTYNSGDPERDAKNATIIGENGGLGVLNISGSFTDITGTEVASRAALYTSISVGSGSDAQGAINISDGGMLLNYGDAVVGHDGGVGNVLVTGENSRWNIAGINSYTSGQWSPDGQLLLGSEGGTGVLTIDDSAIVSLGQGKTNHIGVELPETGYVSYVDHMFEGGTGTLTLTNSDDSQGTLVLKGEEGKVGVLDAKEIKFGTGIGSLVFQHQDNSGNYEFSTDLVDSNTESSFIVNNSGVTVFNRDYSQFIGQTEINGGTLDVNGILGGTTTINQGGTLSGYGTVGDTHLNEGGIISIGQYNTETPANLTIDGNFFGNGGAIIFDTVLEDDSSETDKLIITGDSEGISYVTINNIGGMGAQTVNGIELIEVAGQSNGTFVKSERIVAGAYDYDVVRSSENSNNWVLKSSETVRPEIGGHVANIYLANSLFNIRLYDRLGETQYSNPFTGESGVTSMWLRHQYGFNQFSVAGSDVDTKNHWNITQLGGDIAQWSSNDENRLHLGVMAGYGRSTTRANTAKTGVTARSTLDGYSYGLYATWYDNSTEKTGLYLDGWALWNDFDAKVSSDIGSDDYRVKGITASIESGYAFKVGELTHYDVWLQPQGQLIWQGAKGENVTESNGARIVTNNGNLFSRLGIRTSLLSNLTSQDKTKQAGQLFAEVNWLHNTKDFSAAINGETTASRDGAKNIAELKVGIEGQINRNLDVWFNIAGQKGNDDYKSASMLLGIKYHF